MILFPTLHEEIRNSSENEAVIHQGLNVVRKFMGEQHENR
jgi:hypothetical protein